MKFPVKLPTGTQVFWIAVIGFVVALAAIKVNNNVDAVRDATR